MSLPQFDVQGSLFESLGAIAPDLFADNDKYKLFAKKVWPVLAQCREQATQCYEADNGRPGVEPVVLLGVLIFQFLERVPDPSSGGTGEVSFRLEAGVEFEVERRGFSSDDAGLLPPKARMGDSLIRPLRSRFRYRTTSSC
jgi:hypothetical protein